METAWQIYDRQLWKASQPEVQPELPVRDREAWTVHRRETALTFSDQIPVWLKPPPGKVLVSVRKLETGVRRRQKRRQRRKQQEKEAGKQAEQLQLVPAQAEEEDCTEQPPKTAAVSPGQAPRWRVSFVARQAVERYFQPESQPVGKVLPSIIVVYGTHARLENISQAGYFLEAEQFEYAGQTVRREKGQKAPGTLMRQWRQLRTARPELFQADQVRVWSQPSAVVDSVVYKWQQQLESSEYRQAVDLIDSFVGGWTQAGSEAAFCSQRLRACVGAGTTGLTQLTDIALAQPAKAALSRYHSDLRDQLREKARQEGVAATYKVGLAEILEAARQMHDRMHQLNEQNKTVLRGARAGGWLHWRPDQSGRLIQASTQPWTADLPEGSSKLSSWHLAGRSSWVEDGQPVSQPEENSEGSQLKYEASYLQNEQAGIPAGFFLDLQPDFEISEEERLLIEELLQHPTARPSTPWMQAAQKKPSQKKTSSDKSKQKGKKKSKKATKELVKVWREKAGKKSQEAAMDQIDNTRMFEE